MIGKIRNTLYNRNLQGRKSQRKAKQEEMNFSRAKHVGILFLDDDKEDRKVAVEFAEFLRKNDKQVDILAFRKDPPAETLPDYDVVSKKNLTWFGTPKGYRANRFVFHEFDVLICAYTAPHKVLDYISVLSHAAFKAGIYRKEWENEIDLMIADDQGGLKPFLQSLTHYFKIVNNHVAV